MVGHTGGEKARDRHTAPSLRLILVLVARGVLPRLLNMYSGCIVCSSSRQPPETVAPGHHATTPPTHTHSTLPRRTAPYSPLALALLDTLHCDSGGNWANASVFLFMQQHPQQTLTVLVWKQCRVHAKYTRRTTRPPTLARTHTHAHPRTPTPTHTHTHAHAPTHAYWGAITSSQPLSGSEICPQI